MSHFVPEGSGQPAELAKIFTMNAIRPGTPTSGDRKPFAINRVALIVLAALAALFAGMLVLVFNSNPTFAWLLLPLFAAFAAFIVYMRRLASPGRSWVTASAMPWQQREGWGIFVAVVLYYIVPFLVQGFVGRAFQDQLPSAWLTWWLYVIGLCGYLIFSYRLVEEYCNYRAARVAPTTKKDPPPITGTIPLSSNSATPTLDIPHRAATTSNGEGPRQDSQRKKRETHSKGAPKSPYGDPGNWEI